MLGKRKSIFIIVFIFFSLVFSVITLEIILRFTPYNLVEETPPRYYFEEDQDLGYDIGKERRGYFLKADGIRISVWSNEIGCYDHPYKGEKDFILLVGDSFT